jgi:hypothetical protein
MPDPVDDPVFREAIAAAEADEVEVLREIAEMALDEGRER